MYRCHNYSTGEEFEFDMDYVPPKAAKMMNRVMNAAWRKNQPQPQPQRACTIVSSDEEQDSSESESQFHMEPPDEEWEGTFGWLRTAEATH